MNTTIASKRAARSVTACGGFEGAPGFDASLAAMVRAVGKSDALGSVILLSVVVFRELNGRYVPIAEGQHWADGL